MIKKYNEQKNIAGHFIKQAREGKKMTKTELSRKLQLFGVYISDDELRLIEKNNLLVKDFDVVAIAIILDMDLNLLKTYIEN